MCAYTASEVITVSSETLSSHEHPEGTLIGCFELVVLQNKINLILYDAEAVRLAEKERLGLAE